MNPPPFPTLQDCLQEPVSCTPSEHLLGWIVLAAIGGFIGGFVYGLLRFASTIFPPIFG
jgi:hypothetical protein